MKTTSCPYCERNHAARSPAECPLVESVTPETRLGRRILVVTFTRASGLPRLEISAPAGTPAQMHR